MNVSASDKATGKSQNIRIEASSGLSDEEIEKMRQEGRKLKITGKGRCNITNNAPKGEFLNHVHPKGRFLKQAFSRFFNQDVIKLLESLGVETVLELWWSCFSKKC